MADAVSSGSMPVLCLLFAIAAIIVWTAGTRLTRQVDALAARFGLEQAFAGMLLLGGITSLPELAAVSSSAIAGNASLAVNNLLGSAAVNILLLAIADVVYGRDALTRSAANPATLMQGVLCMMLLGAVVAVIATGDVAVAGVGAGSMLIGVACIGAIRIAGRYEGREVWTTTRDDMPTGGDQHATPQTTSATRPIIVTVLLGAVILVAGALLSITADGIAGRAGLSSGMVGFLLLAFATSLPELSSVVAAVRAERYEMAIGDIFGTNLFNLILLAVADGIASGEPVLREAGRFEMLGASLAMLMTGAFVVGLLERRDKTLFRMGYDSLGALLMFVAGVVALARLTPA